MGVFLDTGFYVGLVDPTDQNYFRSIKLLEELKSGVFGQIYTSFFVMAESATVVGVRTKKHPLALDTIKSYFLGIDQIASILHFDDSHIEPAWNLYFTVNKNRKSRIISFVDCTNIVLCQFFNVDYILAFETHFDAFLTRIS